MSTSSSDLDSGYSSLPSNTNNFTDELFCDISDETFLIFSELLQQNNPLTSLQLSKLLNLTPRVILYRVNNDINPISKMFNLNLICKPNFGIFINNPISEKKDILNKIRKIKQFSQSLSVSRRRSLIILNICLSEAKINREFLSDVYNKSIVTIAKDLNEIRNTLKFRGLLLSCDNHSGYSIVGNEVAIRELLIESILNVFSFTELVGFCRDQVKFVNSNSLKPDSNFLQYKVINNYPLRFYWDQLIFYCHKEGLYFSDISFVELAFYLLIAVGRVVKNKYVVFPATSDSLFSSSDQSLSRLIIEKINLKHQIHFNDDEINFFAEKIFCAGKGVTPHNSVPKNVKNGLSESGNLANDIVFLASQYLHPYLQADEVLSLGLSDHIEFVINRVKSGQHLVNTYNEEIKSKYPYIFRISSYCVELLREKTNLNFPIDEASFLSMHFLAALDRFVASQYIKKDVIVVCNKDLSELILLKARILSEFPNLNILDSVTFVGSVRSIASDGKVDFVISTIPITDLQIPVVVISPFLNDKDINNIKRCISPIYHLKELGNDYNLFYLPSLMDMLSVNFIRLNIHAQDWTTAVKETCIILSSNDVIDNSYSNAVVESLLEHGPYMVIWPNIALLHAGPVSGSRKLGVGLARFSAPVVFNHKSNDPVYLSFVLSAVDKTSHLRILNELNYICTNSYYRDKLINANNRDDVILSIKEVCLYLYANNFVIA